MVQSSDRVVVVTGAHGVLGTAVVAAFAADGARIARLDVDEAPDAQHHTHRVDLTNAAETDAAFARIVATFGRVDVLVNVAGGFQWESFEHGSLDAWDRMYSQNLRTTLVASKVALPYLLASAPGSRIVNIAAGAAIKPAAAGMGAYAASKAGVIKLTESLADELKTRGVTVNAILPSTIDTPRNRADMPGADFSAWVTPADVARAVVFLASRESQAITAATLAVNGRV